MSSHNRFRHGFGTILPTLPTRPVQPPHNRILQSHPAIMQNALKHPLLLHCLRYLALQKQWLSRSLDERMYRYVCILVGRSHRMPPDSAAMNSEKSSRASGMGFSYPVMGVGVQYKLISGMSISPDHSIGETTMFPEAFDQTLGLPSPSGWSYRR